MLVSIIIVNYNTYALTAACLRSVLAQIRGVAFEIILVDNASTERDAADFQREFPGIRLVRSPVNGGFARGNNLGLAEATGDVLLLLNSDTVLEEDAVSKAAAYLRAHPAIGALTVGLYYPGGRIQHYARRYKDVTHELLDLLRPVLYLLPYRKRAVLMLNQYYNNDFDVRCDWVGGAFFMMPRAALEALGGRLDERYFMYGEDQLWCMQLEVAGWERACYAGTRVLHLEGGSEAGRTQKKRWRGIILRRELDLYALRNGKGVGYVAFAALYTTKRAVAFALLKVLGR